MKCSIVIASLWTFIVIDSSQEYDSTLQSQLTAKADDMPNLDFILNSLFYVGNLLPYDGEIKFVYQTTAVYVLPKREMYAYHLQERYILRPFISIQRMTFLVCRNTFVKLKAVFDVQDHIAKIEFQDCSKINSRELLTFDPISDIHQPVLIAGFKEDGTPIIQRAYIQRQYQRPSEIHVSLRDIVVYYESNNSPNYTIRVGDLLIQGESFLGFFMKKIPQKKIAVFVTFEKL